LLNFSTELMESNKIKFLIEECAWFLEALESLIDNKIKAITDLENNNESQLYKGILNDYKLSLEERFIVDYLIPTGNLIAKILTKNSIQGRIFIEDLLNETNTLIKQKVVVLEDLDLGEPLFSSKILVSNEIIDKVRGKKPRRPKFGKNFPAEYLETNKDWSDLILAKHTKDQLGRIIDWAEYGEKILEEYGLKKNIKKGYRALFYGPPGTGKSMTAALIGKHTGKEVYRVDLSMIISKYVGETEKNLANVFEKAEQKDWILFFDEADSLFGKRTQQNSAQDRYANQEVSYLLQRIESYDGIIIMATNLKENMDEAFTRRFQSMIYFSVPKSYQRKEIWEKSFSTKLKFGPLVDFKEISEKYELSGGAIINIVRECAIIAAKKGDDTVLNSELHLAIRNELIKENKRV